MNHANYARKCASLVCPRESESVRKRLYLEDDRIIIYSIDKNSAIRLK